MSGAGGFQYPNVLIPEFADHYSRGSRGNSVSMKAAVDRDLKILQAVLRHRKRLEDSGDQASGLEDLRDTCGVNSTVEWPGQDVMNTPLLQAVRSQLPQNVKFLLSSGANPNGIDTTSLESYQDGDVAERKMLLASMELPQTAVITLKEIEDRTICIAPFWTIHTSMPIDMFPGGDVMYSIVVAARRPSTEILDILLEAGADISAWTSRSYPVNDIAFPAPSNLAVTSPLHVAIEENIPMISHLLSLGFDPDFVPTSTPSTCLTPLMSTFLITPGNREAPREAQMLEGSATNILPKRINLPAYSALISQPSLNLALTTRVLAIHPMHLAVAHGSLPLLEHVLSTFPVSLASITPTTLGHNLLHIACLPISGANLKLNSLAVVQSIHDTRPLVYPRVCRPPSSYPGSAQLSSSRSNNKEDGISSDQIPSTNKHEINQAEQTSLVKFLVAMLPQNLLAQDVYGNTALHYLLAPHAIPNMDSIFILRSVQGGDEAWNHVRNRWRYSARDLFEAVDSKDQVRSWQASCDRELRARERERDNEWEERLAK